ncbi:MAG: PorT family protein [Bacteroidetes bacterium]|nr:MAG: PorT family protein [Bacteroidota bacterium]
MKRTLLFFLLLGVVHVSQAQFSFGLRGGMNFSRLPSKTYELDDPQTRIKTVSESYTGFHAGVMAQISLMGVFVMPELLFVSTGHDLVLEREGEPDSFFQQKFSYIDIPVMVGAKIGPLRAGIGPVASILLNSSSGLSSEESGFKERFNPATYGFQLGAGMNLGNLALDLKYQFGLSNLGDGIEIGETTYNFDSRPRQIVFSIGLLF